MNDEEEVTLSIQGRPVLALKTIKTLLEIVDEQQEAITLLLEENMAGRRIGLDRRSEILARLSRTKAAIVRALSRFKEVKSEQPTTD